MIQLTLKHVGVVYDNHNLVIEKPNLLNLHMQNKRCTTMVKLMSKTSFYITFDIFSIQTRNAELNRLSKSYLSKYLNLYLGDTMHIKSLRMLIFHTLILRNPILANFTKFLQIDITCYLEKIFNSRCFRT